MASINTNASAMTALQTLTATNKNLATTQSRISTGLRVGDGCRQRRLLVDRHHHAFRQQGLSSVQDALGLGAGKLDVAYTAINAVKDTLDNMKAKIVAAQQPDIDKAKIQEEIKQLQNDLKTYAESASFSGGNWLNVSENKEQKIVASFTRMPATTSRSVLSASTPPRPRCSTRRAPNTVCCSRVRSSTPPTWVVWPM
jgi:flagellin